MGEKSTRKHIGQRVRLEVADRYEAGRSHVVEGVLLDVAEEEPAVGVQDVPNGSIWFDSWRCRVLEVLPDSD